MDDEDAAAAAVAVADAEWDAVPRPWGRNGSDSNDATAVRCAEAGTRDGY
jgi:hypothetical protein